MKKIEFKRWYWIIYSNRLVNIVGKIIGLGNGAAAFALWPIVGVRPGREKRSGFNTLINHEKIHLRQQLELLFFFFFPVYFGEIFYARIFLKLSPREAYYFTSAEQEAYRNEKDMTYLKRRGLWKMFTYMRHRKKVTHDQNNNVVFADWPTS